MQIYAICFTHNRLQHPPSQAWMKLPGLLIDWINLREGERAILERKRCDHCKGSSAYGKRGNAGDNAFIAQYITGPAR